MKIKSRPKNEVELLLSELEKSGLSVLEFARRKKLSPATVYGWRARRREQFNASEDELIPVKIEPPRRRAIVNSCSAPMLQLRLRSGHILELPHGASVQWLSELLEELS